MQQDFAELTTAAVNSYYGELSSQIYACLAYSGRHTLQDIVRSTKFSTRQVAASLVVLIEHLLVRHYTSDLGITYYEADGAAAYNAVFRTQKLIKAVDDLYGSQASVVLQEIALRGHATVNQLRAALCASSPSSPEQNGAGSKRKRNGDIVASQRRQNEVSHADLDDTLQHLLGLGYLVRVTPRRFLPNQDLYDEARNAALRENFPRGVSNAKEKSALQEAYARKLNNWRGEPYHYLGRYKGKTGTNGVNGRSHTASSTLRGDLDITLNFEKCHVIMRNDQLANMAHRYIGQTTSVVLRALLQALDDRTDRCYDECRTWDDLLQSSNLPWPSIETILQRIPPSTDLETGLPRRERTNGVNGHAAKAPVTIPSDDSDSGSSVEVPKKIPQKQALRHGSVAAVAIDRHLRLLEQDPRRFVQYVKSGWVVPFTHKTHLMIQYEIENTVGAQYGQSAARIIRILHKNQSNDEKGLAIAAVLKPKDVRQLTNTLLSAGIINTQEIPRDTNRTTNRLLWLYAYSPAQARQQILNDCYRAMVRLLRRLALEKTEYSGTIDKAERTDVVGHEDEYLNEKDRDALEQWNKKEQVMLAQISRIDDLVACMRDFAPMNDIGDMAADFVLDVEEEDD